MEWEKAKTVAKTIAVIFTPVVLVFSAGAFSQYYFAGQQDVKRALCLLSYNLDLIALQVEGGNKYGSYINAKLNRLEGAIDDVHLEEYDNVTVITHRELRKLYDEIRSLKSKADTLADEFRFGNRCPKKGGKLWSEF